MSQSKDRQLVERLELIEQLRTCSPGGKSSYADFLEKGIPNLAQECLVSQEPEHEPKESVMSESSKSYVVAEGDHVNVTDRKSGSVRSAIVTRVTNESGWYCNGSATVTVKYDDDGSSDMFDSQKGDHRDISFAKKG